ncbi:NEFA-interacting nuclear protein NIP30, N-terminal [Kalmanozyma brasiliensis GHG001]|uniref:FAM192A/Fyv6 N-terminal domain-containing protein n=1 Tax=Kalmanozyma brasiliensis (strain GHG001) TaxID=1365824 RepID=V5EYA8_KALBG|nr:NEFA-interacting nuclear protein NIP30, N-terminal [Kalmanozyma brasiliensis GHG001]EST08688.1 NEFA-interacting nuclear protein NIP30, N-terminal [Kalmanozyma brasiliensis GHG001]
MSKSVSSRFVSASDPNSTVTSTEEYDPRSLYDKLASQKQAKDEALDEKYKLANQFRGIDEGESEFLVQVAGERREEERERLRREREEMEGFRAARAADGGKGVKRAVEETKGLVGEKPDTATTTGLAKKAEEKSESKEGAIVTGAVKKKRKAGASALGIVRKKPATQVDESSKAAAATPRSSAPSTEAKKT